MRRPTTTRLLVLLAGMALIHPAIAAPYSPVDVRAAAMGGVGVATAGAASATMSNPALLSTQPDDRRFQVQLGIGLQEQDAQHMFSETDAIRNLFSDFKNALASNNQSQVTSDAQQLADKLAKINGETLLLNAGANLSFGVPGKTLGIGVASNGNDYASATPHISAADLSAMNTFATNPIIAACVSVPCPYSPTSTAETTTVLVAETGVGLSHRFDLAGGGLLAIGATPKVVDVDTWHYEDTVDKFDSGNLRSAQYRTTGSHADLDLGVAWRPDAAGPWQLGLVARDLANKTYDTKATAFSPAREVDINRQYRAGIAHITEHGTLALDVDLAKNKGTGINDETQFVSLGAEYAPVKYVQLRAGYRANVAAHSEVANVATAGIGLGPVDLAVTAGNNTLGAQLQFAFGW